MRRDGKALMLKLYQQMQYALLGLFIGAYLLYALHL